MKGLVSIHICKAWVSTFVLLLFCFQVMCCWGQGHFHVQSSVGALTIAVNGKDYVFDSNFVRVETHYPAFDTLIIGTGADRTGHEILCNFHPDSLYSFIPACCASIDVVPFREAQLVRDSLWWEDYEKYFERIQDTYLDQPFITLKVVNADLSGRGGSVRDSVYGWYVDYACFPSFKMLDAKGWEYGPPVKCFYWNNISLFSFFRGSGADTLGKNAEGVIEEHFPDDYFSGKYEELGSVSIRLFDNRRYVISYDMVTRKVLLEYER